MVSVQRHLALLRGLLQEGETEHLWIRAERVDQAHRGALLLSDRRLLFSGLGFVSQSQEAWPLAGVTDVRVDPRVLALGILGRQERFTGTPRDLERFGAALPTAVGEAKPASIVDDLERLAHLRDAGALSADEFETAKRRLLD